MKSTFAILGAGSWGSAIALHLARNGHAIKLWDISKEHLSAIEKAGENQRYLPGIPFPTNIQVYSSLSLCLQEVDHIFAAVPSHGFQNLLEQIKPLISNHMSLCWGTKGLLKGRFLHAIAREVLGPQKALAVLAGPSFAKEVAMHLPTAVTIASEDLSLTQKLIDCFHSQTFRPYASNDVQGVEIGGVVKNVLAIAVGISDGLGFGANARAALITRGLLEMKSLGFKLGAKEETMDGLAGLGDLILTATDNQSRNRRFGLALGEGLTIQSAKDKIGQVVEGARNAEEVHAYAKQLKLEMPICEQVYQIIYESVRPTEAVHTLLMRSIKPEI